MDKKELEKTWNKFFKKKDKKLLEKLVEHYYFYVQKIANKVAKRFNMATLVDELTSSGLDGLYCAINRYDISRNVKFETYSYSRIRGSMIDNLRSEDWVPRSVRLRYSNIDKAQKKANNEAGYKVPKHVVLKSLDIEPKEYHAKLKKYIPLSVASIENTGNTEVEPNENKKDFNVCLTAKNVTTPGSRLVRKEFLGKLLGKGFKSMERQLIYYHYYEGFTMKKIAEKFDISESRMSQIHRSVLKRLKSKIERNPGYFDKGLIGFMSDYSE